MIISPLSIKRTQFNSVSKLMSEYGTTFHNEKGGDLMHKMLLEGRLILKNCNNKNYPKSIWSNIVSRLA